MVVKQTHGKDRIIPINKKILKFIQDRYNTETKYFNYKKLEYEEFLQYIDKIWNPIMEQLNMNHTPHECRHTRKFNVSKCWS